MNEKQSLGVHSNLYLKGGGTFLLKIERADGTVESLILNNLITNLGLDILIRNLINQNEILPTHIVLSNATTNPDPNETVMPGTQKWAGSAVISRPQARQAKWSVQFSQGQVVGTVASVGLCSDANGSNLFARIKIDPPKVLGSQDTIQVDYVLTLNRA